MTNLKITPTQENALKKMHFSPCIWNSANDLQVSIKTLWALYRRKLVIPERQPKRGAYKNSEIKFKLIK